MRERRKHQRKFREKTENEKVRHRLKGAGDEGEAQGKAHIFQIWLNWVHLGRGCLQRHLLLKLQAPVVCLLVLSFSLTLTVWH